MSFARNFGISYMAPQNIKFFTRVKGLYKDIIPHKNHFRQIYACQVIINSIYSYFETKFPILA